jgi:hypothetical protein
MTSEQFGQLALQLLQQASIPGQSIDIALAFRDLAKEMAAGRITLQQTGGDDKNCAAPGADE